MPASRPSAVAGHHRMTELDGLRGLAVLMVVASHVSTYHADLLGPAGVATFFVLSGFLITSLLLAERDRYGRVSITAFYARRVLRLFPALLLMLILTPVLMWLVHDPRLGSVLPGLMTALFYLQDFAVASGHYGVVGHTWSLSVEEQFYFVWPVALGLIVTRAHGDRARVATIVRYIAGAGLAWHLIAIPLLSEDWNYYSPDCNAVFLLAGCLLATSAREKQGMRSSRVGAVGAIVTLGLVPVLLTPFEASHWRVVHLLLFPAVLLSVVVVRGATRLPVLNNPVLRWFGTISYGLYLWHWVLLTLQPGGRLLTPHERGAVALASVVVAAASWYLFESPILRLKQRFQRVSDASATPSTVAVETGPLPGTPPLSARPVTATSDTVPIPVVRLPSSTARHRSSDVPHR